MCIRDRHNSYPQNVINALVSHEDKYLLHSLALFGQLPEVVVIMGILSMFSVPYSCFKGAYNIFVRRIIACEIFARSELATLTETRHPPAFCCPMTSTVALLRVAVKRESTLPLLWDDIRCSTHCLYMHEL